MTRKQGSNKIARMKAVAAFRESIKNGTVVKIDQASRIVAMSFCEPRSWTRVLSS